MPIQHCCSGNCQRNGTCYATHVQYHMLGGHRRAAMPFSDYIVMLCVCGIVPVTSTRQEAISITSASPACMYTAGLRDLPDGTAVPNSLVELDSLVQRMSFAVVGRPLAPALQGGRVVRGQFGLASRRMQTPSLTRDSRRSPNFTKVLFQYLSQCFPKARVSSCTVAFHRLAPLHVDSANRGPSYAVALQSSEGGHLWVATPFASHGTTLRVTDELCEFDSLLLHTTLPYSGPRYYISYYCHRAVGRLTPVVRRRLLGLCVPLPSSQEILAMRRAAKQKPSLAQRRADGFRQWAAYLRTLPPRSKRALRSNRALGGSWICKHCRRFGPSCSYGGRLRTFCSRACEMHHYRKPLMKLKWNGTRTCQTCGRAFLQRSNSGGRLRYCRGCRRQRPLPASAGS